MSASPMQDIELVSFTITVEGKTLSQTVQVQSINVRYAANKIPVSVVRILDGSPADGDFPLSESNDFIPGNSIEISLGYDSKNESVFKGVIVRHRVISNDEEGPLLEIECMEKVAKLTVARKTRYYEKVKDSDVFSKIISDAGLTPSVESTQPEHISLVQYQCCDWDFMMMRIEANGLLAFVEEDTVSVKAPDTSASPAISLTYGIDMLSVRLMLDAQYQFESVTAKGWDASSQQTVSGESSSPSVASQGNVDSSTLAKVFGVSDVSLQHNGLFDETELKDWANAKLLKSWMARIKGEISFAGTKEVKAGDVIEIKGLGERFNGNAFVSGIEHEVSDGTWITTAYLGLQEEWFAQKENIPAPEVSGLATAVKGLLVGKVKQLESDPNKEYRVQVNLPMLQESQETVWARLSGVYATNGKGGFFLPEIDDEVIVGFLHGDPAYPVVLGSMYSSALPPAYEPTNDNYTKAFVTKGGSKIEIDDEKNSLLVSTPENNQLLLDDDAKNILVKDQNENSITMDDQGIEIKDKSGNKITLSSSGIEISSVSDLKLSAAQSISLEATMNADIKANQNVSVSGLQISNEAQMKFSAQGNAQAELVASGQTVVKGALVMIN